MNTRPREIRLALHGRLRNAVGDVRYHYRNLIEQLRSYERSEDEGQRARLMPFMRQSWSRIRAFSEYNGLDNFPDIPAFLLRTGAAVPSTPFAKPLVYSYTLLKTADTCLYKCFRQYVKRDLPFDKTPEIDFGNAVHEAMEYRLGGKPLPQSMQHWEPLVSAYADRKAKPEKKTGITKDCKPTGFFDKDVWLRCKIDVTMLNGNAVFISDFKTGNSKYEDPFELEIQALTLKAAIPAIERIAGHYAWLKENRIGVVHDLSDFSATWTKINNKVEVIQDCMASGEWPKTKNPLCGWCGVLDCENNPKRAT